MLERLPQASGWPAARAFPRAVSTEVPDVLGKELHDKWQKVRAPWLQAGAPCPSIPLPVPWHAARRAKWQQRPPSTLTFRTSAMLSSCAHRRPPLAPYPQPLPGTPQPHCCYCQMTVNKHLLV